MTSGSTTTDKDFKVKNGLNVAGDATFESNVILGSNPLAFDTVSNKLQIKINGSWVSVAFMSDIPDMTLLSAAFATMDGGDPSTTFS